MLGWRNENKNASFTIRRRNEKELQQAINDLLERGFEVVKQGSYFEQKKDFTYSQSSTTSRLNRMQFESVDQMKRYYAIIKRKNASYTGNQREVTV